MLEGSAEQVFTVLPPNPEPAEHDDRSRRRPGRVSSRATAGVPIVQNPAGKLPS